MSNTKKLSEHLPATIEAGMDKDQVGAWLRLHPDTVRRKARDGELPGHLIGNKWVFFASEIRAVVGCEPEANP